MAKKRKGSVIKSLINMYIAMCVYLWDCLYGFVLNNSKDTYELQLKLAT